MVLSKKRKSRPNKLRIFSSKAARSFKVSRILKDIEEARNYGIQLNTISLNDMYSYLRDARKQRRDFERENPGKKFIYDPMESQQFAWDDDGLAELKERVVQERKDGNNQLRKQRTSSGSKKKRRRT